MENNNSNRCSLCKSYDAYYTLGTKKFNKTKCGWCLQKGEVVEMHGTCENFSRKPLRKRSRFALTIAISSLLAEITEIRKALECDGIE